VNIFSDRASWRVGTLKKCSVIIFRNRASWRVGKGNAEASRRGNLLRTNAIMIVYRISKLKAESQKNEDRFL